MESETSEIDGVLSVSTNTTFRFATCLDLHDETCPLIQAIWSSMRDEGLLLEPEAPMSPAMPELSIISVLPCPKCHDSKASREQSMEGWLYIPRKDSPTRRAELAWIGYALESLGSDERPHLVRWAYVCVELLGVDVTLKLAACFRDASRPEGPLCDGAAARCLRDSVDDYETRKRVRTARRAREGLMASAWKELTTTARALEHQLEQTVDSGTDLSVLNQAGASFQCAAMLYGSCVEEMVKMPEGFLGSSKAPRGDFDVYAEVQELQLQIQEVTEWVARAQRLPVETGLEMLLPFREMPSADEVHRLSTAAKVSEGHLGELRERFGDFQRTVKEIEYVVEAEDACLLRLAWSIEDD